MGLFNFGKKDGEERAPRNMGTVVMIRLLAVGYLCYCFWEILKTYRAGGEEAPQWWMLLISFVVLIGGAVSVAILTYREWKRNKALQQKLQDEEDARYEQEATEAARAKYEAMLAKEAQEADEEAEEVSEEAEEAIEEEENASEEEE